MIGHLTQSLGWTWGTLIVGLLALAAIATVVWAFRAVRREPEHRPGTTLLFGAPVLVVGIALGAWFTLDEWDWMLEDGSVESGDAVAPAIEVAEGAERFEIVGGSTVTYAVGERRGGSRTTAVGTTTSVAGEIALDRAEPSASKLGAIVVNVERFTSDSTLRDRRIRHDFLESTEFPFATFEPTALSGLPARPLDSERVEIEITGDLTVKETTNTETFAGWVELDGDRLVAEMSATVLMSAYDVGPISISGFVATDDEVDLTFALIARPVGAAEPAPTDQLADEQPPDTVEPAGTAVVSYASTVQPILQSHCAACHNTGGVGAATVTLDTAGDVAAISSDIGSVTTSGYMPPWPAGPMSVRFEHDWSLADDDLADLVAWIEAGGPLDVDPDSPLEPVGDAVREVDADVVARGEPYTGTPDQPDDYRCQIFDLGESDDPRWITSFALDPDQIEIVHHAVYFRAPASTLAAAAAIEARDEAPGWPCFGLAGVPGVDQIGAWAPGQQPKDYPPDTGVRFDPGDQLIVQIHYHYDHDFPADHSAVLVDFASADQVAAAGGELDSVDFATYLAPAEIPCTDDESGPLCDRDTVIEQIRDTFGQFAAVIPDGLIAQCGADLAAMMADTDGVTEASCEHRISTPGEIVGMFGHMHELGQTYRMTLNPGTPKELVLLDIPNWSFEWQFDFRPIESIVVEAGDRLLVECTWDRSLVAMPEPRYVTWNEGTDDEMCYSVLATVPSPGP